MAYDATLSVAGNDIPVFEFYISLSQGHDNQGKPASSVFTGDIFIIAEGGNDLFFEWVCDQTRMESGKLKVMQTDQQSTFVEYAFEKAFVTDISESFVYSNDIQNEFNRVSVDEGESNLGMLVYNQAREKAGDFQPLMSAYRKTRDFQRRTGNAFCIFFSLSCEKIRIRDIEHQNLWGK
ncbi:hypothetical protein IC229_10500 [Spirosoma sp. BT702]|uniref:Uncharacterized protein n=1 Tax=Spirosoma profusum TaxID=2771354 RepID=A0A926XW39_9BACT|nr:type VI secretion system tube protein TssD [Spirosoma profusum]MBD2701065.1 hypothetical protein [Spirosoma profusum]